MASPYELLSRKLKGLTLAEVVENTSCYQLVNDDKLTEVMQSHYENLKDIVFKPSNGVISYTPTGYIGAKVAFHLNREFNDLSSYLVYDFLVDLYKLFGKPILPLEISRGCIAITAAFESATDYRGQEFRLLALTDPHYHEVFRRYGLDKMYAHAFPELDAVPSIAFEFDESGKPTAYTI